jgi:hypothetical protein
MNDFFDLPKETFGSSSSNSNEKKKDENIYDPNPDASGGIYKSVVRFIPNLKDKTQTKYTKYSAKVYNPLTKRAVYVDCPSNENKPSVLWTLSTILGRLKKEEPTVVNEINDNFSRWYTHHSYVYIIKDPQNPDLEGKIKLFKYRAQINDLIEQQMNPDEDGLLENTVKVNPFHLLEGKDFLCVVSKKTKTWRDWTKCKFMDELTPFVFNIKDNQVVMKNDEGAIKVVKGFFEKTAPSMEDYLHQSWTDETYNEVASALKAAIGHKEVINMLIAETRDEKMKQLLSLENPHKESVAPASVSSNDTLTNDNISFGGTTVNTAVEEKKTPVVTDGESNDEYDDLFKDL